MSQSNTACRRLLGNCLETIELPDSETLSRGVHIFSIIKCDGEYLGYAGPVGTGAVELRRSPDCRDWVVTEGNPLFEGGGYRWPTAIRRDGIIYLALRTATRPTLGDVVRLTVNGQTNLVRRLKNWHRMLVQGTDLTSIDLYRSPDGVDFTRVGPLISKRNGGNVRNQNPFFFTDPKTNRVGLVYYSSDLENCELRCRLADEPEGLITASDHCLLAADTVLAAPAMFYHPGHDEFVLMAERMAGEDWITTAYTSDRPDEGFSLADEQVLFTEDIACPFPFVENETLWLFLSRRDSPSEWTGLLERYDLG